MQRGKQDERARARSTDGERARGDSTHLHGAVSVGQCACSFIIDLSIRVRLGIIDLLINLTYFNIFSLSCLLKH